MEGLLRRALPPLAPLPRLQAIKLLIGHEGAHRIIGAAFPNLRVEALFGLLRGSVDHQRNEQGPSPRLALRAKRVQRLIEGGAEPLLPSLA